MHPFQKVVWLLYQKFGSKSHKFKYNSYLWDILAIRFGQVLKFPENDFPDKYSGYFLHKYKIN